jgi:hypothetical protein
MYVSTSATLPGSHLFRHGDARALIEEARVRQARRRLWTTFLAFALAAAFVGFWTDHRGGDTRSFVTNYDSRGAALAVPHTGGPLPNPCSLLTNAQVAVILGGRVASRSNDGKGTCDWEGPVVGAFTTAGQNFFVQVKRESAGSFNARFVPLLEGARAVRVSGLQGPAFWQYYGQVLAVWDHGVTLEISGSTLSVYPQLVKRLARAAFKRL